MNVAERPEGSPLAERVGEEDAPVTVTEREPGVPSCGARTIEEERVMVKEPPEGAPPDELQAEREKIGSSRRIRRGGRRWAGTTGPAPFR